MQLLRKSTSNYLTNMAQTNNQYLRERLELRANLAKFPQSDYATIRASQWSHDFERLRRNRMTMGYLRYGPFAHPDKPTYANVKSIITRAEEYERTGNDELLVDIANLAMCEFIEGIHPRKHFSASDDGEHTQPK